MSVSLYESEVKRHESALQRQRTKQVAAMRKAAALEKNLAALKRQTASAISDSSRRSYEARVQNKERDLLRARDDEARVAKEIASLEEKLATAKRRLGDAQQAALKRQEATDRRTRQQRDQAEKLERQRRERSERVAEQKREEREAALDREMNVLRHRTTELEQQLASAERRVAPREVTLLFLGSSPEDQDALRLDKETREIQTQMRATEFRDAIWFEWRLARQITDLIQDLNEVRPDILHFSGHGSRADLVFEDADGGTSPLDNAQLNRLLEAAPAPIRLVLFNSCDSASQASLATQNVDVAIGMDSSISDEAAKTFAAQFYNSLGFGLSVGEAFRQAKLQVDLTHGTESEIPKLFARVGVDPETVVLVNPNAET